jgi:phosphoribosylformylglycinamidine synthase
VLLGEGHGELGGSELLHVVYGQTRGVPPRLDLSGEAALQRLLVEGVSTGLIRSAHDCAEGGIAVTLAECCFETAHGVEADLPGVDAGADGYRDLAALFGESASRAVVSVAAADLPVLLQLARSAGVPARQIGRVAGNRVRIAVDGRAAIDEPVAGAEHVWATAIEAHFERRRAIA